LNVLKTEINVDTIQIYVIAQVGLPLTSRSAAV